MSTTEHNAFSWRNSRSETGKALGRTQTAPKTTPIPITYSKKPAHQLRKNDAQFVGKPSRNPTANINTTAAV